MKTGYTIQREEKAGMTILITRNQIDFKTIKYYQRKRRVYFRIKGQFIRNT